LCDFSNKSSRIKVNQILMASVIISFLKELEVANESLLGFHEASKPEHQMVL